MSPLHAVIEAGGLKETADPKNVLLIRKGPGNQPVPVRLDLMDTLDGNDTAGAIQLKAQDVVYVPKTFIAEANKFVKQYIEDLLLFRGVSLGFAYDLNPSNNN
jgi:protein involved in polysaccharide export with SLBB domain